MAIVKEESKSFPLWFQNGTINANYVSEYFRCLDNIKQATSDTDFSQFSSGGLVGYWGSVLAPNGTDIYFCPNAAEFIGKWDTLTDTGSLIGTSLTTTNGKYTGGVLAPNGFIYMLPYSATAILKLNPSDDTFTTFGNFVGSAKWMGGVCTESGIIYACTESGTQILKIDTNTDTTSLISGASLNGYSSASIAPNGKIYYMGGFPAKPTVLILDPSTDGLSTIPVSVTSRFYGAVLLENSCIYGFPASHGNGALKIDTNTDTTSLIAGVGGVGKNYSSGSIGSDGFAYGIPFLTADVVSINPTDDSITVVEPAATMGANQYIGASVASNGVIYGTPRIGGNIIKIGTERIIGKDFGLSRFNNKG